MTQRLERGDADRDHAGASLVGLCELARWSHGAAAVSIAVVTDDGLEYVASSGAGADEIIGTRLRAGEGLAGFVAATGQSLTVRDAVADPRFARDVAERTGYVPDAIQITPILDDDGDVACVMSMLDRGHHAGAPVDSADDVVRVRRPRRHDAAPGSIRRRRRNHPPPRAARSRGPGGGDHRRRCRPRRDRTMTSRRR